MGQYTRLQAVNHMRLHTGEAILGSLDDTTNIAEYILDQETLDFQMNGAANNVFDEEVTPDVNGHIILRNDTLGCTLFSNHEDQYRRRIRGLPKGNPPKLWNVTEQTYVWDTEQTYWIRYILSVSWEDMESAVQKAIMEAAARRYQILVMGDQATDMYLAEQEAKSMHKAQTQEAASRRTSVFQQLPNMWKVALNPGDPWNPRTRGFGRWR